MSESAAMVDGLPQPQAIAVVAVAASFGGFAYHLWIERKISTRQRIGGVLLSGFIGALAYLWLHEDFDSHLKLVAASIIIGGVGTTLLDAVVIKLTDRIKGLSDVD